MFVRGYSPVDLLHISLQRDISTSSNASHLVLSHAHQKTQNALKVAYARVTLELLLGSPKRLNFCIAHTEHKQRSLMLNMTIVIFNISPAVFQPIPARCSQESWALCQVSSLCRGLTTTLVTETVADRRYGVFYLLIVASFRKSF